MTEPRYESCDIIAVLVKARIVRAGTFKFVGRAIGPSGQFVAGESREFADGDLSRWNNGGSGPAGCSTRECSGALDELINKLAQNGWDHVGQDSRFGWAHSFRRRAK